LNPDPVKRNIALSAEEASLIFGINDTNLRKICEKLSVTASYRDSTLFFTGPRLNTETAVAVIDRLLHEIALGGVLNQQSIDAALGFPKNHDPKLEVKVPGRAGRILPKTAGQEKYLRAILQSDIVFCIGPAGTGKTFLAVASAVSALSEGEVDRIIISRPAVEAGEKLGFLPGDLQQKIDPYLKPVYDALGDTLTPSKVKKLLDSRIIEIAPLAYMRGRTLNNSFIILDEAQNTTITQMKMFLTRLGYGSRFIITGDITQVDIKPTSSSGLVIIRDVLDGVEGIEIVSLSHNDVVRHPLVQQIITAFEAGSD